MVVALSRKKAVILALSALVLAAWFLPSRFSAEHYRSRLESGLGKVLHRHATFGSATFQLLPQPHFTLDNVLIYEDPAFGHEPFARIDRVDCDLRWDSLWHRHLDFDHLHLSRPSFNVVRNEQRQWNIENFLARTGVTGNAASFAVSSSPLPFDIDLEDARLNFKQGDRKKPFAVVDLRGRLNLDPSRNRIRFDLTGNPIRTDLTFPPPGFLEVSGEWRPGPDLKGAFDVSLHTRGASVYYWVPLLTGINHDIYGEMDADVRIHGPLRAIRIEGESFLTQVHRWESPPPTDPVPIRLQYRVAYESELGRLAIESAEVSFAGSRLHLSGTVGHVTDFPEFDLVVALERSRLEDWSNLAARLTQMPNWFSLAGRLDGLVTIQGPPGDRRFGGFIEGRDARLVTSSGDYTVSNVALRLDQTGAKIEPVTISIGPRCKVGVEGSVYRPRAWGKKVQDAPPPVYEIKVVAKSANLQDALRFAQSAGIAHFAAVDIHGAANVTALLRGTAWPPGPPRLSVKADVRSARLLVPGLTEPVNVPRARLLWTDSRLVMDDLTAVIGSSIFTGRLEHAGQRANPWIFDLRADALKIEEGAAWFDSLGHRPPLGLLDRIPGLRSLSGRRKAASGLFTSLNARGRFTTPQLTYRSLRLKDFEASLDISHRILGLSEVSFRSGGGRGAGLVRVDMTQSPADISGELSMKNARLESVAGFLGPALGRTRGFFSGSAQFNTRGLSRSEMRENLRAEGRAILDRVDLGGFDPLAVLMKRPPEGKYFPPHRVVLPNPTEIVFGITNGEVRLVNQQIDLNSARLLLNGSWNIKAGVNLEVTADLRRASRSKVSGSEEAPGPPEFATVRLTGPLGEVRVERVEGDTLARRSTLQW